LREGSCFIAQNTAILKVDRAMGELLPAQVVRYDHQRPLFGIRKPAKDFEDTAARNGIE
jgi:hypothetical protein